MYECARYREDFLSDLWFCSAHDITEKHLSYENNRAIWEAEQQVLSAPIAIVSSECQLAEPKVSRAAVLAVNSMLAFVPVTCVDWARAHQARLFHKLDFVINQRQAVDAYMTLWPLLCCDLICYVSTLFMYCIAAWYLADLTKGSSACKRPRLSWWERKFACTLDFVHQERFMMWWIELKASISLGS